MHCGINIATSLQLRWYTASFHVPHDVPASRGRSGGRILGRVSREGCVTQRPGRCVFLRLSLALSAMVLLACCASRGSPVTPRVASSTPTPTPSPSVFVKTTTLYGVRRRINLQGELFGVAYGSGSVWVGAAGTGSVFRFDAASGRLVTRISVPLEPFAVTASANTVWVSAWNNSSTTHADRVVRIDATTNRVTGSVAVGDRPYRIVVDSHGVWVINPVDGDLLRVDPVSLAITKRLHVHDKLTGLAVGGGYVWVSAFDLTLTKIRESDVTPSSTQQLEGGVDLVLDGGFLYGTENAYLQRTKPDTGDAFGTIQLHTRDLVEVASAGDGQLWAVSHTQGVLCHADAGTSALVQTITISATSKTAELWGVATDGTFVWVTDQTDHQLVQVAPAAKT